MIEHVWSLLCSGSSIDRDTNSLSIFNVIDDIRAVTLATPPEGSALPITAHLVSLWRRTDEHTETGEARVTLRGGAADVTLVESHQLELSLKRLRSRVILGGLPVHESGQYELVIEYKQGAGDWMLATRVGLDVTITVQPEPTT